MRVPLIITLINIAVYVGFLGLLTLPTVKIGGIVIFYWAFVIWAFICIPFSWLASRWMDKWEAKKYETKPAGGEQ